MPEGGRAVKSLCTEVGYSSLNKVGEQLCGDSVEYRIDDNGVLVTLADGLGSGVKASILSTLTAKILTTMLAGGMSIDSCVETMVKALPVCKVRGIAYSTFTIMRVTDNRRAELIQFDNPRAMLFRDGKNCDYPVAMREIAGKQILESSFLLEEGDVLFAVSDGAVHAGVGRELNYGWTRDSIIQFIEAAYEPEHSAQYYAGIVAEACGKLYAGQPGDDTTAVAVRLRARHPVSVAFGPPADPSQDEAMMNLFFAGEGARIVCGGTTAEIAARHLKKPRVPSGSYFDPDIPPITILEGVDLVTEGIVTLSQVAILAENTLRGGDMAAIWARGRDGASLIAQELIEKATDIRFFVGRAVNPAHQAEGMPTPLGLKAQLIERLATSLKKMGKHTTISFY